MLLPDEFQQFDKHLVAGAGFVSNFALWSEAGYFDRAAEVKPLLHLWSLGIEEKFYILWPLLLGIVWYRKSSFLMATLLVAILSFVINIYWAYHDPSLLLCTEQRCMVTTENGVPIYKDESHLRPFFVEQQAGFMDVTVQ